MLYRFSLLLFICTAFLACETIVEFDLPETEPQLVLNSLFNTDSTLTVYLYKSRGVEESSALPETVAGALVTLSDGNGNILATLTEQSPGIYTSSFVANAGVHYHIKAEKEGYKTVSAADKIPQNQVVLDSYRVIKKYDINEQAFYHISLTIDDPPGNDFYEVMVRTRYSTLVDYVVYSGEAVEKLHSDDHVISEHTNGGNYLLFKDVQFNARQKELVIYSYFSFPDCVTNCSVNAIMELQINKVSPAYYNYKETMALQTSINDNPFAEPVSVYSNIRNGYGIFAGYSQRILRIRVS